MEPEEVSVSCVDGLTLVGGDAGVRRVVVMGLRECVIVWVSGEDS